MGIYNIDYIGVQCDMPDCYHKIEIRGDRESERKFDKIIKTAGWEVFEFPGIDEWGQCGVPIWIYSCPSCQKKEKKDEMVPATKDNHDCLFVQKRKDGTPSAWGKFFECFICGRSFWIQKVSELSEKLKQMGVETRR